MAPKKSDKKIAYDKARKERKKQEKAAAAAESSRTNHPPKEERHDWAAMKASLVFDERGFGRTPDGNWMYFPKAEPASQKALPAGDASERSCWMSLAFEEEGEAAREMMPETDDEDEREGKGKGKEGEDVEMGEGGELEGGVAGMALE